MIPMAIDALGTIPKHITVDLNSIGIPHKLPTTNYKKKFYWEQHKIL